MILPALAMIAACCVTGTVTHVARDAERSGILQPDDGSAPFWFAGENNGEVVAELCGTERLKAGDRVEIRGERSALGFVPGIAARAIARLGRGTPPPPAEVSLRDLDCGMMDNARVALSGVLTAVKPKDAALVQLSVSAADGPFVAMAPADAADWNRMVDAKIRLTGAAMSRFNIRGEFIGVLLQVEDAAGVRIVEAAADPFALPIVPLGSIMSYSGRRRFVRRRNLHRCHVKGVVTYARPGEFLWLAEGESTLKVWTDEKGARAGDEVEAVGFASREYGLGTLVSASCRVTGHPGMPAPERIGRQELTSYPMDENGKFRNFDGRRVWCEGRLVSVRRESAGLAMHVEIEGGVPLAVHMDGEHQEIDPDELDWDPQLRLTGVLELVQEKGPPSSQMPKIEGWRLRVAGAADVAVLRDARWTAQAAKRFWRRLLALLGAAAGALFGWVLVYVLRLRGERRRMAILTSERKRMAADLHDTLEQHLAGARMVLNSAISFTPEVPESVREAVASADELLAHAKTEMRARIYDLRSDVLFTQGPERVIRTIAAKLSSSGVAKVRTRLRSLPETLPEQQFSEIVFMLQEALTNAVKHGKAKNIVIASDPCADGFRLTVANDGEPFDPSAVLGPEAGHYGLTGMRERARRAGVKLEFRRHGRWVLVVLTINAG